jgi:peptidoglycan hydrolase-like protein with peptidoglycan-binding domain
MTGSWGTRCILALSLVSALPACSYLPGHDRAATPVATAPQPVANSTVRDVQDRLKQQGYYKQGPVDGVWGAGTMTAVEAYQRDHNLTASGKLDVPTLKSLNVADINNTAGYPSGSAAPATAVPNDTTTGPTSTSRDNTTPLTGPNGTTAPR